ncbi:MAG: nucleotidyl transferase AbiEii/AbiGii toxin family protein [Candidatus Krumholzibacteria bacterium]|nr:nucleotidyl transferase AbiEii/AbiGii toxin family protein [Candidatus Krumholzibacteria bacterium]
MREALSKMLEKYDCGSSDEYTRAMREIMQEIALLGLWRSRFFEHAAFYGGTALRILYGLDRFSEDLDFSLITPDSKFELRKYGESLQKELEAFGFSVEWGEKVKTIETDILSAFLKANTYEQLLVITRDEDITGGIHPGQMTKIKIEVDTDPPPGFSTESRYLLLPIPFYVRTYTLPDLFAGKMHAVLCRKWKGRVKGRDWYDLVWYAANHPELNLGHLEQRMRQSGHREDPLPLTKEEFRTMIAGAVEDLDIESAKKEVEPFVRDTSALTVWSNEFFQDVASRIVLE